MAGLDPYCWKAAQEEQARDPWAGAPAFANSAALSAPEPSASAAAKLVSGGGGPGATATCDRRCRDDRVLGVIKAVPVSSSDCMSWRLR
eukprot:scaffold283816_cov27-Tisochrysis_lutea.AAC.2